MTRLHQVTLEERFNPHSKIVVTKMRNRFRVWQAFYIGVNGKLKSKYLMLFERPIQPYVIEVE